MSGSEFLCLRSGLILASVSGSERVCRVVLERWRGSAPSLSPYCVPGMVIQKPAQSYSPHMPLLLPSYHSNVNDQYGLGGSFLHLTRALFAPPGVGDPSHAPSRTLGMDMDIEMGTPLQVLFPAPGLGPCRTHRTKCMSKARWPARLPRFLHGTLPHLLTWTHTREKARGAGGSQRYSTADRARLRGR